MEVRIYFEGDPKLRPGFRDFFRQFQGPNSQIQLIGCGANVVEGFMDGIRRNPDAINVMLKDSEAPGDRQMLIGQVQRDDHWNAATARRVNDEHLHFMVEIMESWFLADREVLRDYYGQGFNERRLRGDDRQVERIPKDDVLNGLNEATRATTKRRYHKTKHAPEILARIDPGKVRSASPACERLFRFLQTAVESTN